MGVMIGVSQVASLRTPPDRREVIVSIDETFDKPTTMTFSSISARDSSYKLASACIVKRCVYCLNYGDITCFAQLHQCHQMRFFMKIFWID